MDGAKHSATNAETDAVGRLLGAYLDRRSRGEQPSRDEYLEQLASPEARREFLELLSTASVVERSIPTVVEPGAWMGRYRIEAKIGEGGMGVVFRAFDPELERAVAIKVLAPDLRLRDDLHDLLKRESRLLAQLNHPGLVAIHEAGQIGDTRYLVMDLVDGLPLARVLSDLRRQQPRRLSGRDLAETLKRPTPAGHDSLIDPDSYFRTVARIAREVVRAIEAAHGRGVLHLDMNPKNVMLTGGAHPLVLDFGLARSNRLDTARQAGLFGTLPYLAPEQFEASSPGDERTDIYQLGLTLYEMLTLTRAFEVDRVEVLEPRIQRAAYRWPREVVGEVPRDLEAICLKAIRPNPGERYPTARDMREDLERFLEGVPTVARPPGVVRRIGLAVRRHRASAAAVATLVFLLTLSGFMTWHFEVWPWPRPADTFLCRDVAANATIVLDDGSIAYDNDLITLWVNARRPCTYYAISLSGPELDTSYVRPLSIGFDGEAQRADWLEAPRGDKRLITLTRVSMANSPPGEPSQERVWVFRSRSRCAWVEQWLAELEESSAKNKWGVPFAIARESFERLSSSTRGDRLDDMSAQERASLAAMARGLHLEQSKWLLANPERIKQTLVIKPGARPHP